GKEEGRRQWTKGKSEMRKVAKKKNCADLLPFDFCLLPFAFCLLPFAFCLLVFAFVNVNVALAGAQIPIENKSSQRTISADDREKIETAREMIIQARNAIGGEEALVGIKTLSVSAKLRRPVKYASVQSPKKVVEKEKTLSGKVEVDILLPDKFRRRVSNQTLRGFPYSYVEIVNGDRAWRDPPLRARSSNSDNRVIDVDDFERTVEMQTRGARQQLTIYSLGLLLRPLPGHSLEFTFLGEIRALDGRINVIVAKDPEDNQMFLLLDAETKLPLALAWTFIASRQQAVIVEAAGIFDRKFMMETVQRARRERQERILPPQRYEMQMKFSEYKQVAGVLLPHRITTTLNKEIIEELIFEDFEINRSINPKKFEGQPEPRY
ncbi:MAG: hypothetical protein L0220_34155, partial [Acidobacteria bacterium]|nr:hypothetical protein [Acidobacteriota bacterium]